MSSTGVVTPKQELCSSEPPVLQGGTALSASSDILFSACSHQGFFCFIRKLKRSLQSVAPLPKPPARLPQLRPLQRAPREPCGVRTACWKLAATHGQKGLSGDGPLGRLASSSDGSRVFFLCHFQGLKTSLNRENQRHVKPFFAPCG